MDDQINASGILPNSWMSEIALDDWWLIQDCIVGEITRLRIFRPNGYEYTLKRLESILERVVVKYKGFK